MGAERAISHHLLPPLCKGRWRTDVSRRGCRSGAGESRLVLSARSCTTPTTPQSGPFGPASSPYTGEPSPAGDGVLSLSRLRRQLPRQREPSPAGDGVLSLSRLRRQLPRQREPSPAGGGQGIGAAETPGIKAAGAERNQRIVSCAQAEGLGVLQAVLPAAF